MRDRVRSHGLGDVLKRQVLVHVHVDVQVHVHIHVYMDVHLHVHVHVHVHVYGDTGRNKPLAWAGGTVTTSTTASNSRTHNSLPPIHI